MNDALEGTFSLQLFAAAADSMLVIDATGKIMLSNPTAQRLFGYPEQKLHGLAVEALMPERYRGSHHAHRAEYARDPRRRPMGPGRDLYGLRRDGSEFAAEISLSPLDGGLVLATIQDVTERKRTEAALRKFSRVIEQTASTVVITNVDGLIEYVNPRFVETTGYTAAEALGKQPNLLKSGHTTAEEYQELWRTIAAGGVWHGEFLNRRKDGSLYWESAIISAIRNERGRITHFVGIKDDITARKRAEEQALRETEQRFRATFEQAAVGIAHVAPSGRWLRVNRKLCDIVGYSREELLQRNFQDITHPDDLEADLAQARRLIEGEIDNYSMQKRYIRKDGNVAWINFTVSVVRQADSSPDYLIAVVEDIGERKQVEATVRDLRAEMEQLLALHVASQTAAAIAHELNQPLNAVTSYTEAALRMLRAGNPKPDKLHHALENSALQAQRAGQVVRELLLFLQKSDTSTELVDLNDAARRARAIIEADDYGFQTELDLTMKLKPVLANRLQVEKVMVNLLRNSLDAMTNAGIKGKRITIRTVAAESMGQVTVQDNGPGLDKATAKSIFEPFFTTKPSGVGMGLTISRTLIEAHGGKLWFDAESSPGATFHFALPFAS